MKKIFIVANWKSNFTSIEANSWLQGFKNYDLGITNKEIIICPPFTLLSGIESRIKNQELRIKLGVQDVSPFDEGAYTGEVSAKQIKEFADYVIIGHSERRQNFNEQDEVLFKKIDRARANNLIPIFCVQGKETKVPQDIDIIAYEPTDAIGTGNPDTPENAESVASFFKANFKAASVLYGGSVNSANVASFTKMPDIDGVLVGKASLDVKEFYKIIHNA